MLVKEHETMKKILALCLSLMMVLSLAACGSGSAETPTETVTVSPSVESQTPSAEPETEPASSESRKALVVYYSATSHTENVANYIAAYTGADLFELEPVEPYTDDDLNWRDSDSRVVYEHDNEDARTVELVSTSAQNWDEYDTVLIGYPIWWGIAAWPVDGFVAANDFTGKTVIPFCTAYSSGIGQSGTLLEQLTGTGKWLPGQRFTERPSQADIESWVETLDLG
jgi:flavodoxin/predicted small lipoprotein YifL